MKRFFKIKNILRSLFSKLGSWLIFRELTPFEVSKRLNKISKEILDRYKVTFIVPTYNGMNNNFLPRLIESIKKQTFSNIEIIAIDSESTDGTEDYLRSQGVKIIKIPKEKFRHDYARNLAASYASGDFIVFTVQDAEFSDPHWVEIALRHVLAFGAVSFSSFQKVDKNAEPYAKFLSHNFIKTNNYKSGSIIIGSEVLGKYIFKMLDRRYKARAIHVDDVNHLVRKDFFLQVKYKQPTCEDMDFGREIILRNKKWVFSTITYVTHYHSYLNYSKYFIRTLVDNLIIGQLLDGRKAKIPYYGVIDHIIVLGLYLIYMLERTFDNMFPVKEDSHYVVFDESFMRKVGEGVKYIKFSHILDVYTRDCRKTETAYLTYPFEVTKESNIVRELMNNVGLIFPLSINMDYRFFTKFIEHALSHAWYVSHTLLYELQEEISLRDYFNAIANAIINVWTFNLAECMLIYEDPISKNLEILNNLKWM